METSQLGGTLSEMVTLEWNQNMEAIYLILNV